MYSRTFELSELFTLMNGNVSKSFGVYWTHSFVMPCVFPQLLLPAVLFPCLLSSGSDTYKKMSHLEILLLAKPQI